MFVSKGFPQTIPFEKKPLGGGVIPVIADESYRQFLDTGLINPVEESEFEEMLSRISHKHQVQAQAFVILLYYTGRRPNEILDLTPKQIKKRGKKLEIMMATSKKGRYTVLFLPLNKHLQVVLDMCNNLFYEQFLFWGLRSKCVNRVMYKCRGELRTKSYVSNSRNIWYWVKKWTKTCPYFFRHSRFSKMSMMGATTQEIAHAKGAASLNSVQPYIHLSAVAAKKMVKFYK